MSKDEKITGLEDTLQAMRDEIDEFKRNDQLHEAERRRLHNMVQELKVCEWDPCLLLLLNLFPLGEGGGSSESVRSWCDGSSDRSFMECTHWAISRSSQCSTTGVTRGMCYPVCEMVHIKEPLLLIGKSSLCGSSGIPFSLSEWSLTICRTPYFRK